MKKVNEDRSVIYVCECGKEFEKRKAFIGHCSRCETHLGHKPTNNDNLGRWAKDNKNKKKRYNNKNYSEPRNCQYCGKECKNQNSLIQHEIRCKENPNHIKVKVNSNFKNYNEKVQKGEIKVWNKGLTKETDERIAKASQTRKDNIKSGKVKTPKGRHLSERAKQNIREGIAKAKKEGKHHYNIGEKRWKKEHSYP